MMGPKSLKATAGIDDAIEAGAAVDQGSADKGRAGGHEARADAADKLEYLADMILELQQMALHAGHDALAGQLARAYAEAGQLLRSLRPAV